MIFGDFLSDNLAQGKSNSNVTHIRNAIQILKLWEIAVDVFLFQRARLPINNQKHQILSLEHPHIKIQAR